MKKIVAAALSLLLVDLSPAWAAGSAWANLAEHLHGRLSIGTRVTMLSLADTKSPGTDREAGETYIGFINELEMEQDYRPLKPFISYFATPFLGLELTHERVKAKTWNIDRDRSDGSVSALGPILSLILRYPNSSRFTPHAGVGIAFWGAAFDEEPWWRFGYNSPEEWAADGAPDRPTHSVKKTFRVDDSLGVIFQGGVDILVYKNWSIDLLVRYAEVDIEAKYYRNTELRRTGSFPLSHTACGAGLRYTF